MEERVGVRRGVFIVSSSVLSPTRSSRGEDGELDAALSLSAALDFFLLKFRDSTTVHSSLA
jgi:hypothetical protein